MRIANRPGWPGWVRDLLGAIAAAGRARPGRPVPLEHFAVADLPDAAAWAGALIHVPDETGGAVPAFSDGSAWRRLSDLQPVS